MDIVHDRLVYLHTYRVYSGASVDGYVCAINNDLYSLFFSLYEGVV